MAETAGQDYPQLNPYQGSDSANSNSGFPAEGAKSGVLNSKVSAPVVLRDMPPHEQLLPRARWQQVLQLVHLSSGHYAPRGNIAITASRNHLLTAFP